jgi:hypothetical protein
MGKYQTCTWHGERYNASSFGQPTLTSTVCETTRAGFKRFALRCGEPVGVGEFAFLQGGNVRSLTVFGKGSSLLFSMPQTAGGLSRAKAAAVAGLGNLWLGSRSRSADRGLQRGASPLPGAAPSRRHRQRRVDLGLELEPE